LIPKPVVNRFAYQNGIDLHSAQQDVILVYALDALHKGGALEGLAFKGGTFLRKVILGRDGRFSEDLDFTEDGLGKRIGPTMSKALEVTHHGVSFHLDEPRATRDRTWATTVRYGHEWDEGTFSLEVSTRERVCLPPESRRLLPEPYFGDLPFTPSPVRCMAPPEALAEKLRALQQRDSERDLFDIIRYASRNIPKALVRLVATVKLYRTHEPFRPEAILEKLRSGRKDWSALHQLLGKKDIGGWNAQCRKAAERLRFLTDLTDFEKALIVDCRRHRRAREIDAEIARTLAS